MFLLNCYNMLQHKCTSVDSKMSVQSLEYIFDVVALRVCGVWSMYLMWWHENLQMFFEGYYNHYILPHSLIDLIHIYILFSIVDHS